MKKKKKKKEEEEKKKKKKRAGQRGNEETDRRGSRVLARDCLVSPLCWILTALRLLLGSVTLLLPWQTGGGTTSQACMGRGRGAQRAERSGWPGGEVWGGGAVAD